MLAALAEAVLAALAEAVYNSWAETEAGSVSHFSVSSKQNTDSLFIKLLTLFAQYTANSTQNLRGNGFNISSICFKTSPL